MKNLYIIIITGLSGSGKSTAINALEDSGYFCVDNLPVLLLPKFLELYANNASEVQKVAFGMDLRQKEFVKNYHEILHMLRNEGYHFEVFFLESSEEVLVKRFSETRRQHPISEGTDLLDIIRSEKRQLRGLKEIADKIIDTSNLTVHQLKDVIIQNALQDVRAERMRISVISFGFKYGIPLEADLLMDVRFIPNPYFVPELKKLDGKDERVRRFVTKWDETREFLEKYFALIEYLLPLYEKEGKSYLTIAVGCTGGRHRSVTIAEEICGNLRVEEREVTLKHRDIELSDHSNSSDSSVG
ncbi:MAG: RNase adapter RapZ [Deltaproteobacteria bacterium]|uniref:RNase adapter RapZ n=1 Tax=Candidatus Desulfacyla euxinica TaxID=2841693 RepID=A0A8J6N1U1_9DELT|nr:RNase adapter RapZ [Candidatus Desulfacyla euxinica]MBL7216518.1 RNase adapter RapZ [Desulfobacteraceae bacterium]